MHNRTTATSSAYSPTDSDAHARHSSDASAPSNDSDGGPAPTPSGNGHPLEIHSGPNPRWKSPQQPQHYTAGQMHSILSHLTDPHDLLCVTLQAFAGLRVRELKELTWENIDGHRILIPGSKQPRARLVPVQDALAQWLAPFLGQAGLVVPNAARLAQLRAHTSRLGIKMEVRRLRSSFLIHRFVQTNCIYTTCQEGGLVCSIMRHLYVPVTSADAAQYWKLTPAACEKADWDRLVKTYLRTKRI